MKQKLENENKETLKKIFLHQIHIKTKGTNSKLRICIIEKGVTILKT